MWVCRVTGANLIFQELTRYRRLSSRATSKEIAACAKSKGTNVNVEPKLVDGALQALLDLRPDEHNRLIAEAAAKQEACDVIALAQFSMAPAKLLAATRTTKPILTTPDSAVAKLKALLG